MKTKPTLLQTDLVLWYPPVEVSDLCRLALTLQERTEQQKKQKFGFIKRVDKGWITTVKDLERWRFER